jgi:hypothetical protein
MAHVHPVEIPDRQDAPGLDLPELGHLFENSHTCNRSVRILTSVVRPHRAVPNPRERTGFADQFTGRNRICNRFLPQRTGEVRLHIVGVFARGLGMSLRGAQRRSNLNAERER